MKALLSIAVLLSLIAPLQSEPARTEFTLAAKAGRLTASDRILARAFKMKTSEFMIKFRGTVIAILDDDDEGSRHQRFIVQLRSGQTLLIAHNIDLAPRVSPLKTSDKVTILGEYIWNSEGGIIHWTHHDPDGSEPGGWIRRKGLIFR